MDTNERKVYAYENFSSWLRDLVKEHSTRTIEAKTGIDHSTISRLVTGPRIPTLKTANKLINEYIR